MKLLLNSFFLAFVIFFLTKEFVLFNPELVFIVSFLIFFFLALENVSSVITEAVDKREQEIRDEFHALLLQKLNVLSKTYSVIYNLCFTSVHLRELDKFMGDFSSFATIFLKAVFKANRRYNLVQDTIYAFKNAVYMAQKVSENNIHRFALRAKLLLKKRAQRKLKDIERKKVKSKKFKIKKNIFFISPVRGTFFISKQILQKLLRKNPDILAKLRKKKGIEPKRSFFFSLSSKEEKAPEPEKKKNFGYSSYTKTKKAK